MKKKIIEIDASGHKLQGISSKYDNFIKGLYLWRSGRLKLKTFISWS